MLADFSFAQPVFFLLLLAWPLIQLVKSVYSKRFANKLPQGDKTIFYLGQIDEFMQAEEPVKTQKSKLIYLARTLAFLALIFFILALARPQIPLELPPDTQLPPTRDLVVVLESSVSFVLEDYLVDDKPASRLAVVKLVLDSFIEKLERSRFSLIIYAENAYTLVPLTPDNQAARFSLNRLEPYLAGRQDYGMGEALGLGLRELLQDDAVQKRALILVSDGLQSESAIALPAVASLAKQLEAPIYTLGIGAGEKLAETQQAGLIYQPLETASLRFLAQETGGDFYQINSTDDLDKILQSIEKMEAVNQQEQEEVRWTQKELYPWFIALGVFSLLLWSLVTLGGRKWN